MDHAASHNSVMSRLANVQRALRVEHSSAMSNEFPFVVVVGEQSAGKSSLLQAIVGLSFIPVRAGQMCTRVPLMVTMYTAEEGAAPIAWFESDRRFPIQATSCEGRDNATNDFTLVETEILARTSDLIQKYGGDAPVGDFPINLFIATPTCKTPITLTDLPGLIYDQSPTRDAIDSLVTSYVARPNAIVLAVFLADRDAENQVAIPMIRHHDPKSIRTIGVLTKVDTIDDVSQDRRGRGHLIRQMVETGVPPANSQWPPIPYVPVYAKIPRNEVAFFAGSALWSRMTARCGTAVVSDRAAKLLIRKAQEVAKPYVAYFEQLCNVKRHMAEQFRSLGDRSGKVDVLNKLNRCLDEKLKLLYSSDPNMLPVGNMTTHIMELRQKLNIRISTLKTDLQTQADIRVESVVDDLLESTQLCELEYRREIAHQACVRVVPHLLQPAYDCAEDICKLISEAAESTISETMEELFPLPARLVAAPAGGDMHVSNNELMMGLHYWLCEIFSVLTTELLATPIRLAMRATLDDTMELFEEMKRIEQGSFNVSRPEIDSLIQQFARNLPSVANPILVAEEKASPFAESPGCQYPNCPVKFSGWTNFNVSAQRRRHCHRCRKSMCQAHAHVKIRVQHMGNAPLLVCEECHAYHLRTDELGQYLENKKLTPTSRSLQATESDDDRTTAKRHLQEVVSAYAEVVVSTFRALLPRIIQAWLVRGGIDASCRQKTEALVSNGYDQALRLLDDRSDIIEGTYTRLCDEIEIAEQAQKDVREIVRLRIA